MAKKLALYVILIVGTILAVSGLLLTISQDKSVIFGCSPEFWANNLELWEVVGVDYNDNFDETFGKDYFEPDITLEQAISLEGVGTNHLARAGTTAYLNALVDPEIDEVAVKSAVGFGYIHQIDKFNENCKKVNVSTITK